MTIILLYTERFRTSLSWILHFFWTWPEFVFTFSNCFWYEKTIQSKENFRFLRIPTWCIRRISMSSILHNHVPGLNYECFLSTSSPACFLTPENQYFIPIPAHVPITTLSSTDSYVTCNLLQCCISRLLPHILHISGDGSFFSEKM